jgi:hypothetical protein
MVQFPGRKLQRRIIREHGIYQCPQCSYTCFSVPSIKVKGFGFT